MVVGTVTIAREANIVGSLSGGFLCLSFVDLIYFHKLKSIDPEGWSRGALEKK